MSRLLSTSCASGLGSDAVEEFQDVAQVDPFILIFGRLGLSLGLGGVMSVVKK
jgi:hypothetical protein